VAHPWSTFSPEANYTALMSGSGPASTLAYGGTFAAEAANLQAVVATSAVTGSATYGTSWQGVGAAASAVTQTGVDTQHELLVAALLEKVPHVAAAASAHQTALASMVTAQEAVANRMQEAAAEQINPIVLGALTPQITALNLQYYGHMWPRNAAAGAAYGAALRASAAAIMVPFPPAVAGASPAAPAAEVSALAETGAMSAAGATMQASEQAAQALVTPAMAASQAGPAAMPGAAPLAGGPASPAASAPGTAAPLAATQTPAQTVTGASQAPVGMFSRLSQAGMVAAPTAARPVGERLASSQVEQALSSRADTLTPPAGSGPGPSGVVSGYPGAGLTSYVRPIGDAFTPPTADRATSAHPGMLNAATLRGPVTTAPLTTTNSTLTATQPLAYVHPEPPRPTGSSAAPQPPLLDPGDTAHTLNSPPPSPQPLTPPPPAPQPDAPQSGTPGPSTGSDGPSGSGGPGAQMLGSGGGQAPQAPPFPIPLDPQPPAPPPSPGNPPLRPPPIPSWASPPLPKSVQAAQSAYNDLIAAIDRHNSWRPDPTNLDAVNAYNQEAWYYNTLKARLESQLDSGNAKYTPASPATRADIPSWTQPAPEQPHAPSPDPSTPTGQRGGPMDVPRGTNAPATIDGTAFSGHALDEMQSDGIPVSAVQNALRNGLSAPSRGGRTIFYDPDNHISVVRAADGTIITVTYGDRR
jgi:PPE family